MLEHTLQFSCWSQLKPDITSVVIGTCKIRLKARAIPRCPFRTVLILSLNTPIPVLDKPNYPLMDQKRPNSVFTLTPKASGLSKNQFRCCRRKWLEIGVLFLKCENGKRGNLLVQRPYSTETQNLVFWRLMIDKSIKSSSRRRKCVNISINSAKKPFRHPYLFSSSFKKLFY